MVDIPTFTFARSVYLIDTVCDLIATSFRSSFDGNCSWGHQPLYG